MLPAATLPLVPAFTACTGMGGLEPPPGGRMTASAVVANFTPLLFARIVPVGISTCWLPWLVKMTWPVARAFPTWLVPVAVPLPVALFSKLRTCEATVFAAALCEFVLALKCRALIVRGRAGTAIVTRALGKK